MFPSPQGVLPLLETVVQDSRPSSFLTSLDAVFPFVEQASHEWFPSYLVG